MNQKFEACRKKADALLEKMSLTEKIGQLSQFGTSIYTDDEKYFEDHFKDGKVGSYLTIRGAEKTNKIQKQLLEISRLAIPALFAEDVIHGYKTIAPIPLAQSCTWNPQLTEQCCSDAAEECSAAGIKWVFSPMVDIARDPRWGRIAEGYGEDSLLCGDFAKAAVRGYQGEDVGKKGKVLACLKHYVAYGACEGGADYNSVDMSLETLMDVYIPPFQAGIDAGARTVMSSFNDLNGVPCSANRFLLRDILCGKLGFRGFVVSDANSVGELTAHGFSENDKQSVNLAFNAGVDMLMAGDMYNDYIPELIREGKIDPSLVDDAVRNILTLKYMVGLFDEPFVPENETDSFYTPEHLASARECARQSIVLLENDGVLPVQKGTKIGIVGPLADNQADILGTWACMGEPEHSTTIYQAFVNQYGKDNVVYARGCGFTDTDSDWENEIKAAVEAVADCKIVLACVGEPRTISGEAQSRSVIDIPGHQKELIEELVRAGKKVCMVVGAGRPLILSEYRDKVSAILYMWHLGTETGNAVADVVSGAHNPSGHLTVSFPRTTGQIPVYYNHYATGKPALGRRHFETKYQDCPIGALYPFGYGKSYTDFQYSNLRMSDCQMKKDGAIKVTVTVENTGEYDGYDVVQLYVQDLVGSRVRPVKELKGYQKVFIKAKQRMEVSFLLHAKSLSFTLANLERVVEPGKFRLWVSQDSQDHSLAGDFFVLI